MELSMKKITAVSLLTALLFSLSCFTAFGYSERQRSIPSVRITIQTGEIEIGDELSDDADSYVTVPDNQYYTLDDAEWLDDIRSVKVGDEPRMKVYLSNSGYTIEHSDYDTVYSFRGSYNSSNVRVTNGEFISAAKRDGNETLEVTLRIKAIKGHYDEPEDVYWTSSRGVAKWNAPENGSGYYDVVCYRGSTAVKRLNSYHGTSYNFYPYMTKAGEYTVRVRTVAPENVSSSTTTILAVAAAIATLIGGRLADRLAKDKDRLGKAMDLIRSLNPKPGQSGLESASPEAPTLIPDFYLSNEDGQLVLSLNAKNDPNLKVSPAYEQMLEEYGAQQQSGTAGNLQAGSDGAAASMQESVKYRKTREAAQFVMQKIDSARWFMEMIRQRKTTMLRIMQAVVDYQHDYFLEGDIAKLKPMRLKDIAEKVGMDISTVSRVINNKYIQTHFGTFLVKEFFSQSTENEEGEEISTSRVKAALQQLVDKEDKRSPLTDDELESALRQQGFVLARRTVAKYREGLGIPIARMRKQL